MPLNSNSQWTYHPFCECRSEELVPLSLRAQRVQVVAPRSGTTLWADIWVVPAGAGGPQGPSPLLPLWFELPLQPAR